MIRENLKRALIVTILLLCFGIKMHAQFAPQALQPGSTAMHKDSSVFKDWAHVCNVVNGWMDIANTSLGSVSNGTSAEALGYPDGQVVSLGDTGEAVYYFENPIVDSQGYDFAVFENGFINMADSNMAFLELAYVEVSNNGINYVRFHSTCNNDTTIQIAGSGDYMDARKVNNLAGKYIANFGTPFDLNELAFSSSLQLDNIRYVKIVDVVGSVQKEICRRDFSNHIINDPYPTPYNTGGFDLDALGIIHQKFPTATSSVSFNDDIMIFPNPARDMLHFQHANPFISEYQIEDLYGRRIQNGHVDDNQILISNLTNGSYILTCWNERRERIQMAFVKW